MDIPFDALPGAHYIRELSPDIVPDKIRQQQEKMNVPCLDPLGCRFLFMCVVMTNPKTIIDIGCGIGASTSALVMGAPDAHIDALDANIDRFTVTSENMQEHAGVKVHHAMANEFLRATKVTYDFAFVDTIKKDYISVWYDLQKVLNPKATIIFDDVLMYGYTAEEEATVPIRYLDGRNELRNFLYELSHDSTLLTQIVPIGGGMLLVKLR